MRFLIESVQRYPRGVLLLVGLGAWGLVTAGFVIQEMYRLNPCPLCIFQRVLYLVFGALALLGAALPRGQKFSGLLLALLAFGGFLTSVYQSFMQAFPGVLSECSYTNPNIIERFVDTLGSHFPALFLATGFCGDKDWLFLGLSMANWSLICFTVMGGLVLIATGWCFKNRSPYL